MSSGLSGVRPVGRRVHLVSYVNNNDTRCGLCVHIFSLDPTVIPLHASLGSLGCALGIFG